MGHPHMGSAGKYHSQSYQHIIQTVGCPEPFHSDQGANFDSALLKELCKYYERRNSWTTPYHPEGNATCERWNQTLLDMLGTLESEQRSRLVQHLPRPPPETRKAMTERQSLSLFYQRSGCWYIQIGSMTLR